MRVDAVNNTTFGLRKLASFQDLAKQRNLNIIPMESEGVKNYIEYIKHMVIKIKRNEVKAIESAKKIFIK